MLRSEPQQKHNQAVPKKGPFFLQETGFTNMGPCNIYIYIYIFVLRINQSASQLYLFACVKDLKLHLAVMSFIHANLIAHGGVGSLSRGAITAHAAARLGHAGCARGSWPAIGSIGLYFVCSHRSCRQGPT